MGKTLNSNNLENENPMNYIMYAINNLTKAQMAYSKKFDKHMENDEEFHKTINNKLEKMNQKINKQQNLLIRNSANLKYIESIIQEVSEHFKIPKKDITYENVVSYRNSLVKTHELSFDNMLKRVRRLYYIRNINKAFVEFESEICGRLGKTRRQIREEPHYIAAYFYDGYGDATFNGSLEMNKYYMKVAKDVIFDMEKKYGIFDTNKEYGIKLSNKIRSEYKEIKFKDDKEYINWVDNLIKEYKRIFNQPKDEVIPHILDGFELYCKDLKLHQTFEFTKNYIIDIHMILNNDVLRKTLPKYVALSFVNLW